MRVPCKTVDSVLQVRLMACLHVEHPYLGVCTDCHDRTLGPPRQAGDSQTMKVQAGIRGEDFLPAFSPGRVGDDVAYPADQVPVVRLSVGHLVVRRLGSGSLRIVGRRGGRPQLAGAVLEPSGEPVSISAPGSAGDPFGCHSALGNDGRLRIEMS